MISIIMIAMVIEILSVQICYAESNFAATIEITADKTTAEAGDIVTFTFAVVDIANAAGNTVSGMEGVISYNTDFFETIDPDNATGMVVNPVNGMISAAFSASADKEIGTLQLQVKENPTGEGTVTFAQLAVSDGEAIVNTADQSFTIVSNTTQNPDQTPDVNEIVDTLNILEENVVETNQQEELLVNKVDNTIADTKIPQTGATPLLLGTIAVVGIIALVVYKNYASFHDVK